MQEIVFFEEYSMQDTDYDEQTDAERAYYLLRESILHTAHQPGEKLKREELKQRYGLGSSPLREALSRLSSEGLVVFSGGRGFRVAGVSLKDLRDIASVRKILESAALRQSIADGDDRWEAGILAAFHRLSVAEERLATDPSAINEWELRNREFHEALGAASQSDRLRELAKGMYDLHERYRRLSRLDRSRARDVHAEHKAIMEAALMRDTEGACRLSEAHIDETTATVARLLPNLDLK